MSLAGYISLSRERPPYVQSIREKLIVEVGQTPLSENVARRREVFSVVFEDVEGAFLERLVLPTWGNDAAYHHQLVHIRLLDPTSQATQIAALDAIATALSDPTIFSFDTLFKLDAVLAAQVHPLFALIRVFLSCGPDDLHAWQHAHADTTREFSLDTTQLERKIHLLALANLGFQNIGQDLAYAQVFAALQVPTPSSKRSSYKRSAQTLRVTRAAARAFGSQEWALLVKRLTGWREGLAGVLDVVASARRRNDAVTVAVAPAEKQSETPGEADAAAVAEATV